MGIGLRDTRTGDDIGVAIPRDDDNGNGRHGWRKAERTVEDGEKLER
jgi:hypothetical protein